MSEKSLDPQGRMRSKTIAFRMSPEEADLLQRYADMSGMTKQDYLISRVLQRDVTVIPGKRMQLYMEENMLYVFKELRRLDAGQVLSHDLLQRARRGHQQQDQGDGEDGLRLPQHRQPRGPAYAQVRRLPVPAPGSPGEGEEEGHEGSEERSVGKSERSVCILGSS